MMPGTKSFFAAVWLVFACLGSGAAQSNDVTSINDSVRTYVNQHRQEILQEFEEFLAIPNLASDAPNIARNAEALLSMLKKRGLEGRLLTIEDAPPVVLAALPADSTKHTVIFYAHYDGQPVSKADWKQDPWLPTLTGTLDDPEARLYARSAGDDKAAVIGLLAALDALKAAHVTPSVNLKFVFEGEEEAGSPHLAQILSKYQDQLRSDLWVVCDGPTYQNGDPELVFGSRGVVTAKIKITGPNRPLHSGHYGNWAPNPIVELAQLLTKLRNTDAEILIPHFYDSIRPLTASENAALKSVPQIDQQLKTELGLQRTEGKALLAEQIMKPALNVDRIEGGGSGPNAANAIPASATAHLDFRLVPNQTPELVRNQLESYLRALGYLVYEKEPPIQQGAPKPLLQLTWGAGYPPQRTDMDAPVSKAFIQALRNAVGDRLVLLPTLGGSTPSFIFEQQFKAPVITLPIANYDDNQHAANENLKLKNLWDGIGMYAGIFARLGKYWTEGK